jgi:aromatic ring-opening dioxygenase catalytic subunit (LigB family)
VFDQWLEKALLAPQSRKQSLIDWEKAPSARDVHPRAEHLLPLMVVAGAAAGEKAHKMYSDFVMGKAVSAFQFG